MSASPYTVYTENEKYCPANCEYGMQYPLRPPTEV